MFKVLLIVLAASLAAIVPLPAQEVVATPQSTEATVHDLIQLVDSGEMTGEEFAEAVPGPILLTTRHSIYLTPLIMSYCETMTAPPIGNCATVGASQVSCGYSAFESCRLRMSFTGGPIGSVTVTYYKDCDSEPIAVWDAEGGLYVYYDSYISVPN